MTGTFTAGAVLTAANLNTAINSLTINAQSGAGYTLVLTDAGKLVTVSNASAQNLTIPLNSSVAYSTGTVIEVLNIGAGTWTLVPTGGVTLTGSTSIPTSARVRLTKTGTDTWYANVLSGGGGLTFITSTSFTTSSAVNVNNCFTSTYDDYVVNVTITTTTSAAGDLTLRMRASSVDASGATDYTYSLGYSDNSLFQLSSGSTGASSMLVGQLGTSGNPSAHLLDLRSPALAAQTRVFLRSNRWNATTVGNYWGSGLHKLTTAYDGFSLIPASGNITGSLRVFGYQNS